MENGQQTQKKKVKKRMKQSNQISANRLPSFQTRQAM